MRILIAEDEPVSRRLLQKTLEQWGYEVVICEDGTSAWNALRSPDAPGIAVLDWMMPGMDGPEICRAVRESGAPRQPYLMLLTSRTRMQDVVAGLKAGADDYLTKPVDREELEARLSVAARVVQLQQRLSDRVAELEEAVSRVRQLQRLLPICAYCKRIRDDQNYWNQVESYIAEHLDVRFSHGICPSCLETVLKEEGVQPPAIANE
ncbi:MAG TPA: response regulator [Vicinamibacterales bacterium]|nr:response regulator [Vicinamibacterales bacterium]